jgi:hypothetical protein
MNQIPYRVVVDWREPAPPQPVTVAIEHRNPTPEQAARLGQPRRSAAPGLQGPCHARTVNSQRDYAANPLDRTLLAMLFLLLLGPGSAPRAAAQTGSYTLNGGTATPSSLIETTSTTDQSGIFVYNSGVLTVGTVAVTTSGSVFFRLIHP